MCLQNAIMSLRNNAMEVRNLLPEELNRLVDRIVHHRCEMQNVELKKAEKGTPERLYDTLSGFSNQSGGGVIVFGIDEKNDLQSSVFTMHRICK